MRARLTPRRLACIALAATALAHARLRMALTPEPTVAAFLTDARGTRITAGRSLPEPWLRDLAWAICGLARRMPFRADCLVRVLASERLLRGRAAYVINVQAGHLGAGFAAHAWLRCDGIDMTGGPVEGLHSLQGPA